MPSSIENILDQISQARDSANAANERRYGQLLNLSKRRMRTLNAGLNRSQGTLERRVGETQALLESSGRGAKRDIRREGAEAGAQTTQQLINSGLYNSSTSFAMQQRQRESTGRQIEDVEERVSSQKAGTLAQTLGDLAGFQERAGAARSATIADKQGIIERRTDQQPNMDLYAQLLQAFGQGQGAQGGRSQTTIGRPPPPGGPSFGQGGTGGERWGGEWRWSGRLRRGWKRGRRRGRILKRSEHGHRFQSREPGRLRCRRGQ
jgi:hypothetical protein